MIILPEALRNGAPPPPAFTAFEYRGNVYLRQSWNFVVTALNRFCGIRRTTWIRISSLYCLHCQTQEKGLALKYFHVECVHRVLRRQVCPKDNASLSFHDTAIKTKNNYRIIYLRNLSNQVLKSVEAIEVMCAFYRIVCYIK